MKKNRSTPYLAALGFSIIFGLSFLVSSVGLRYTSPINLIAYRFLIAYLSVSVLRFFKVIEVNYKGKNTKLLYWVGIMQPVLYFIFEVNGINLLPSSEAGMMIALIPVVASLISVFYLKEKLSLKQSFFILISFIGVFYINYMKMQTGFSLNFLGLTSMFGAVICASLYNNFSKQASTQFTPIEITYHMMKVGAIVFNLLAFSSSLINNQPSEYYSMFLEVKLVIPVIYLGMISSIIGFFLMNYSLSKLPVSSTAVFANIVTIVSIIGGVVLLDEHFSLHSLIGSLMIITGVYGTIKNQSIST